MTSKTWYRMALGALAAALVTPGTALAQDLTIAVAPTVAPVAAPAVTPLVETAPVFGPRITQSGVRLSALAPAPLLQMQAPARRREVAWMVLGGATLVVGSVVGGDGGTILMVTGGVIGLVGLWRYLQYS